MKRILSVLLLTALMLGMFSACAETVSLAYKNGSLRLRKGPGTTYGTNGFLSDGDSITVLSKGSIWSMVRTSGGRTGYIKNLYISGIGDQFADGTVYYGGKFDGTVITKYFGSTVNLRSGASTSTSSIEKLVSGTKVKVLGENGNWYLVETSKGAQGYMSKTYIKTNASSTPVYAYVNGSVVNLRVGPGTDYAVKDSFARGTLVQVLDRSNAKWWRVSMNSVVGYMSANYLKLK